MPADRAAKPSTSNLPSIDQIRLGVPVTPAAQRRAGMLAADYALDQGDPEAVAAELVALLGITGQARPVGCEHCGRRFLRPRGSKGKRKRFCSHSCANSAQHEARRAARGDPDGQT